MRPPEKGNMLCVGLCGPLWAVHLLFAYWPVSGIFPGVNGQVIR